MKTIFTKKTLIKGTERTINLIVGDITYSNENFDLLLCSSFINDHYEKAETMMKALGDAGINVDELSKNPLLKLESGNFIFWISQRVDSKICKYIGCVEIDKTNALSNESYRDAIYRFIETILSSNFGFEFKRVAMPSLGTGFMKLDPKEMIPYQVNAVKRALMNNYNLTEVTFFNKGDDNSAILSNTSQLFLDNINNIIFDKDYDVFISHSSAQNEISKVIFNIFKARGLHPWLDRKTLGIGSDFSEEIVNTIDKARVFVLLLTKEANDSDFVFNELTIAVKRKIDVLPYKIGDFPISGRFEMFLSSKNIENDTDLTFNELADKVFDKVYNQE